MAAFTDQPMDKLALDTERDFYMTPDEAKDYGLIDEVIFHKRIMPKPKVASLKVPPPLSLYDLGPVAKPLPKNDQNSPFKKSWS